MENTITLTPEELMAIEGGIAKWFEDPFQILTGFVYIEK